MAARTETRPLAVPVGPSGHRPSLDGLRAVAVYLVVLFHAGSDRLAGGFIGVDVFFVLSGYLVTQLLLRDLASVGSIRLGRFYARRFRRLLPASLLAILVTAVAIAAVLTPAEVVDAVDAFQASLLYSANWFFIEDSAGYFGEDAARSPVLHFWSLAVEEQFYVIWPLLLGALIWATGRIWLARRWLLLRAVVAVGTVASLAWALSLSGHSPDRAYYGTDTRAYQLLTGAVIALSPGLVTRARRLGRVASGVTWLVGATLLLLATWIVNVGPITRGIAVCALTGLLLIGLERTPDGLLCRLLSRPTLVYLGQISYGTYLWHWPVIILIEEVADLGTIGLAATTIVLATSLAALSFALVEVPVRQAGSLDRWRPAVIVGGLALSVVSAAVIVPAVLDPERSTAVAVAAEPTIEHLTPRPEGFDQVALDEGRYGRPVTCVNRAPDACTVRTGRGPHVLLLGDSNAVMLIEVFRAIAEQHDLTLTLGAQDGCSWVRGLHAPTDDAQDRARCDAAREDLHERVIPAVEPDVVVAIDARPHRTLRAPAYGDLPGNPDHRRKLLATVDQLTQGGRSLVIIEPLPRDPLEGEPLECLARTSVAERCRFLAPDDGLWIEAVERELAVARDDVWTLDLDRRACPLLPICDAVIGDEVVWWDGAHLTPAFALTLDRDLATALQAAGLLPTG